jgi:8-amino-7-oxononanoate synthase
MEKKDLLEIVKQQSGALYYQSQALLQQTEVILNNPNQYQVSSLNVPLLNEKHSVLDAESFTQEVEQTVFYIISNISPYTIESLDRSQFIVQELGFDSLMVMQLQNECNQHFSHFINVEAIFSHDFKDIRIDDIINIIVENRMQKEINFEKNNIGRPIQKVSNQIPTNTTVQKIEAPPIINRVIDESCYQVKSFPEYVQIKARIDSFNSDNPYFRLRTGINKEQIDMDDQVYINYASYNYLGFSGNERVQQAIIDAVKEYGSSVSASRMLSGEIPIHQELEQAIARFIGTEDAILYTTGHATNVSTIASIVGPEDLILHDKLAHNSLIQGCRLSGATRQPFAHNDWQEVENHLRKLRSHYRRVLIVLEGTYSMDGDIPDLKKFIQLKHDYQAMLFVDEAHSIGTIGETGRGVCEYSGVNPKEVDFLMGTLSKSLASCGGYIAASKEAIEFLKYTSDGFVFSAGMTPANTAAALESIRILEEDSSPVKRLYRQSALFLELCKDKGLNTGLSKDTPIVPILIADSEKALKLGQFLFENKINVFPILYPAVPEDEVCLRFFITSNHTDTQIYRTVDCIAEGMKRLEEAAVLV